MRCDDARQALSARLDGEATGVPDDVVEDHLAGCPSCRDHGEELATLHRMVRVREADAVPDLTAAIMAAAPELGAADAGRARSGTHRGELRQVPHGARRADDVSWTRWALFAIALTQLVLAAPGLVLGEAAAVTSTHVARELGAFEVALAVGLLVAAWQPARAYGLLPLASVLAAVLVGTAAIDLAGGGTALLDEGYHLLEVIGVALLWRVAKDPAARTSAEPSLLGAQAG